MASCIGSIDRVDVVATAHLGQGGTQALPGLAPGFVEYLDALQAFLPPLLIRAKLLLLSSPIAVPMLDIRPRSALSKPDTPSQELLWHPNEGNKANGEHPRDCASVSVAQDA